MFIAHSLTIEKIGLKIKKKNFFFHEPRCRAIDSRSGRVKLASMQRALYAFALAIEPAIAGDDKSAKRVSEIKSYRISRCAFTRFIALYHVLRWQRGYHRN